MVKQRDQVFLFMPQQGNYREKQFSLITKSIIVFHDLTYMFPLIGGLKCQIVDKFCEMFKFGPLCDVISPNLGKSGLKT